jgi:hypothetical protein
VLGIGGCAVLLTATLSRLAVVFIGGGQYGALQGRLWAFAVLGTLLAMIQLLVYNVVARQHRRMVFVVWAALVAVLCSTPFLGSLTGLLRVVVVVDTALFVVLLMTGQREPRGAEAPQ